nr:nematode resistance protein-like HSPRO2 [Arachis hypogaea]
MSVIEDMGMCAKGTGEAICSLCNYFRSKELVEVTKMCREMKRMVPEILEVEVDPKGGPGIVEAAMRVYAKKENVVKVLQAMQGIEAAMKRFFFGYKQVVAAVMGMLRLAETELVPTTC